ncbi:hypothetical protein, partial [Burkholderia gladioli]|uniref:hypothetical protein n=1 Tax=Burkholderia gladioli TaxID=28095 RepID=UPI001ABB23D0
QYRHNLFDRKALAFHGKPPPGSGSSLPQNSLSDWSRIPNADQSLRGERHVHRAKRVGDRSLKQLDWLRIDFPARMSASEIKQCAFKSPLKQNFADLGVVTQTPNQVVSDFVG